VKSLYGLCLCLSSSAAAFTIETAFSEACQEKMTIAAYRAAALDWPSPQTLPPPDRTTALLIDSYAKRFDFSGLSERQRLFLFSLLVGLRSPDTDGHSILELNNTRLIHVPKGKQYRHLLREPDDDGDEGNRRAVEGTRTEIVSKVHQATASASRPVDEQFIEVETHVEFYGMVPLKLWAPAFHLGEALHRVQDSFSHTLRSDDLRRVWQVVNYADGLHNDYDEARDGLRHSAALDGCGPTNAALVAAATQASVELMQTASKGDEQLYQALDSWLTYQGGCTIDNGYCQSRFLAAALQSQSRALLGCVSWPGQLSLWVGLLVWIIRRKRT
jgi:hypothetical protein